MPLGLHLRTLCAVAFLLPSAIATAALQVHLPFDENVGDVVFNGGLTGSTNNGTIGTANTREVGKIGAGSLGFDNTAASSFTSGANPVVGDALRTVSFWFNNSEAGGLNTAVSFGVNTAGGKLDIDIDGVTGHLELGLGFGRTDSAAAGITTPVVNDGTWRLATVVIPDTLDGDALVTDFDDLDIYVDAVFSYSGSVNNAAGLAVNTGNSAVFIGRGQNGGQNFDGLVDDVAIWDNPLTPDEIKGLYDVGDLLGVNAGVFDKVAALHGAGSGTIFAGDYSWTFASGLSGSAGISGAELVLDDGANTGVTFAALVAGDVNNNGVADQADFDIITANFNDSATSRTDGDLNSDGVVDFSDFRLWKDAASASSVAVPEPGSLALLAGVGLLAFGARRRPRVAVAMVAVAVLGTSAQDASAQAVAYYFLPANGDFNADASWDSGFRPEAALDETGIIGSTVDDAVFVNAPAVAVANLSTTALSPGALDLGLGEGSSGTLNITSGGSLTVATTATVNGVVRVGVGDGTGGRGFLDISGTGSLSAESIAQNGFTTGLDESEWSRVSLSDTASLTSNTGSLTFNRVLSVTGPDVTVNSAAGIAIGARGRYVANVTGSTHSILSAAGALTIDGSNGNGAELQLSLSGGATLGDGDSLTLFDSASVTGNFGKVTIDGVAPVKGQGFVLNSTPGGVNGLVTSLDVTSQLVLEVNRDTGAVQITQPFGSPIPIDGYSINSAAANLGTAGWTSLEDQAVSDWTEANGASTAISELKPVGSTAISGAGFDLGTIFTPDRSVFGATIDEDLVFEYVDPATGDIVNGQVFYSGTTVNDLVLIVDPTTGEAQLRNTSQASIAIDGYQIGSTSGALSTSGWSSLDDQMIADWTEAGANSFSLSELLPDGVEVLSGDSGFNLGTLFTIGGDQDLSFDYFADGANVLQSGQVLYAELPDLGGNFLEADFNMDGSVDLLDLDILGSNFGMPGVAATGDANGDGAVDLLDLDILGSQFGMSSSSSAMSVPEPAAGLLALLTAAFGTLIRRPRRVIAHAMVPAKLPKKEGFHMDAFARVATRFSMVAAVLGVVASAPAQTILFNADFSDANAGPVTAAADLGTSVSGTFDFGTNVIGGIGGANPKLAVAQNGNANLGLTEMASNNVTYSAVFPETQVADAGSGDTLLANFGSPGLFTGGDKTEVSFNWGIYGTSNTGAFKYQFVRGLDSSDNEVFELLLVAGSGNASRQVYARGVDDDSTTLTAGNSGTPEGTLLASGFTGGIINTNPSVGPADSVTVDVLLEGGQVLFDIGATNDTFTAAEANGTLLAINSAATTIDKLEFSSVWNASVENQNKGYWLDNLFAITTPNVTFTPGDVDGDGNVDLDDFNIIAANFKSSVVSRGEGDLNSDGFVDFADFREWKTASASSTALSVPEPTTVVLGLLAAAGLTFRRRV